MTVTTAHAATSADLTAAGGTSIRDYLQAVYPESDSALSALAPPTPPSALGKSQAKTRFETSSANKSGDESLFSSQSSSEEEMTMMEGDVYDTTPFYIKVRGKGKGRPVMFDRSRSSVAQLYERSAQMYIEDPVFTHTSYGAAHCRSFTVTVRFDDLVATSKEPAGSINAAKELACTDLALQILVRSRDLYKLRL